MMIIISFDIILGKIQEKTIGTAKISKLLDEETPLIEPEGDVKSDGLWDMMNNINQVAQNAFREAAKHNPEALHELSKLDISDLIKVFSSIFSKTTDVEDAYRQLLKGVQELGAKKFIEQFSDTEVNESDSLEKGYIEKLEKIVKNMMSNPEVFSKMDNSKLHHLVKEYLTQVICQLHEGSFIKTIFFIRLNPVLKEDIRKIK